MSEWISVKDRLPESNTEVLVYSKRRGVTIDFVDAFMLTGTVTFYRNSDVTHWMPIPEPPPEDLALCRKLVSVNDSDAE